MCVCVDIFSLKVFTAHVYIGIVKYNDHTSAYVTLWWHNSTYMYTLYIATNIPHIMLCTYVHKGMD